MNRDAIAFLAQRYPKWRFIAVEPSGAMLALCRQRAAASGFESRCVFHHGFLESLAIDAPYDAATSGLRRSDPVLSSWPDACVVCPEGWARRRLMKRAADATIVRVAVC